MEAAYKSVVRGEERVKLIQEMIRRRVGFPGVEHFFKKQSQHCRVETYREKRQVKQILISMKLKLSDAVADLKKLRIRKSIVRQGFLRENDKATYGEAISSGGC